MIDSATQGMGYWDKKDSENISNYTRWQLDLIKPHLGMCILEIGPAGGRLSCQLTSEKLPSRYVVIEPSPILFQNFKTNCPNIEAYNCTLNDMGEKFYGKFDTVLFVHVLEHIQDDQEALILAQKFLAPGGRIIILVPTFNFLMSDLDRKIGHFRRYEKKGLANLGRTTGLKPELIQYNNFIGLFGWLWFCKILKIHYQSENSKRSLMGVFNFFDKKILPIFSAIERWMAPPIGLQLIAVFKKSG